MFVAAAVIPVLDRGEQPSSVRGGRSANAHQRDRSSRAEGAVRLHARTGVLEPVDVAGGRSRSGKTAASSDRARRGLSVCSFVPSNAAGGRSRSGKLCRGVRRVVTLTRLESGPCAHLNVRKGAIASHRRLPRHPGSQLGFLRTSVGREGSFPQRRFRRSSAMAAAALALPASADGTSLVSL